jgi:transposase
MAKLTEHTLGIDISKTHLDVFRLEDQAARRFENAPRGFRALIRWLGQTPVARIVFEPTGPDHRAFETALSGKLPLVKVNPLQARRFAEACGTRAKTNAIDARILARMGAALRLEPDAPAADTLLVFKDLQVTRTALVKERTRLRNRSHVQLNPLLNARARRA